MTDDTPKVQPALSEAEWKEQIAHDVGFSRTSGHGEIAAHVYVTLADVTDGGVEAIGDTEAVEIHWNSTERVAQLWDRRKLAALCLYQQPFGFSREMANAIIDLTNLIDPDDIGELLSLARAAADRIAALLPPVP